MLAVYSGLWHFNHMAPCDWNRP